MIKTKKKQEIEQRICVSRAPRGKRKFVTVVTGLTTCGQYLFFSQVQVLLF